MGWTYFRMHKTSGWQLGLTSRKKWYLKFRDNLKNVKQNFNFLISLTEGGHVYPSSETFENAALPFISLACHKNGAFQKHFSNRRNLKPLALTRTANNLKTDFFEIDDVMTIT